MRRITIRRSVLGGDPPTPNYTTQKETANTMSFLSRIHTWAMGPSGWLTDCNIDEQYSAIDQEWDALEAEAQKRQQDDEWIKRLRNQYRDGEDHPA